MVSVLFFVVNRSQFFFNKATVVDLVSQIGPYLFQTIEFLLLLDSRVCEPEAICFVLSNGFRELGAFLCIANWSSLDSHGDLFDLRNLRDNFRLKVLWAFVVDVCLDAFTCLGLSILTPASLLCISHWGRIFAIIWLETDNWTCSTALDFWILSWDLYRLRRITLNLQASTLIGGFAELRHSVLLGWFERFLWIDMGLSHANLVL